MLRGIAIGFLSGGALGIVIASVISLISPLPSQVELDTASAAQAEQPNRPTAPSLNSPSQTDTPLNAEKPASVASASDDDARPDADQASAPRPEAADLSDVAVSDLAQDTPQVAVTADDPVVPSTSTQAIATPEGQEVAIVTPDAPARRPEVASTDTSVLRSPEVSGSPEAPTTINVEVPQAVAVDTETGSSQPVSDVSGNEVQTSLLQPARELESSFPQLTSERLPTVGETEDAAQASGISDTSPLVQFAARYERINTRPVLSVVLIDEGKSDLDITILREFPVPLSIAVDPLASNAAERARQFRAMGLEVLALVDLPEGAKPSDVAVNMSNAFDILPESIAVIEGGQAGLQSSREVADEVIEVVKSTGHGLVMLPKGLNTAQKMAQRDGVPSVTIFRDFDGANQSEVVMRRFLDQAAFKARQQEGVLMLGRLRDDTLAALAIWTLADRASTVALAPASVLLTGK